MNEFKEENWKNSEVVSIFVQSYLEKDEDAKPKDVEEVKSDEESLEPKEASELSELKIHKANVIAEISNTQVKLADLIRGSDNEITRYKIERAIVDLEAKKQGE